MKPRDDGDQINRHLEPFSGQLLNCLERNVAKKERQEINMSWLSLAKEWLQLEPNPASAQIAYKTVSNLRSNGIIRADYDLYCVSWIELADDVDQEVVKAASSQWRETVGIAGHTSNVTIQDSSVFLSGIKGVTIMGDSFSDITNSTIINRSLMEGSFNKVQLADKEAANLLSEIAELVQKSDNKEVGEIFNEFNLELQKEKPRKTLLQTFWNGLTKVLPTLLSLPSVAVNIEKLFGIGS